MGFKFVQTFKIQIYILAVFNKRKVNSDFIFKNKWSFMFNGTSGLDTHRFDKKMYYNYRFFLQKDLRPSDV